jgi:hypothetical protein
MHEVNGCTGGQSLLAMASGDRSLAARLESPAAATHPLCQANERRIGVAASTFAEHSAHSRNIISGTPQRERI